MIFHVLDFVNHSLKLYSQIYLNIHKESIYLLINLLFLPRWHFSLTSIFLFFLSLSSRSKIFFLRVESQAILHHVHSFQTSISLNRFQMSSSAEANERGSLLRNWSQHWFGIFDMKLWIRIFNQRRRIVTHILFLINLWFI